MAELMEHVQVLADEIGPRPVSTEEEHRASLYVEEVLRNEGLEVDVDEFNTSTGVRWPYAISFILAIVGTLVSGLGKFVPGLSTMFFALGLIMVAVSLFIYLTERLGRPVFSKMLERGVSQNVVARYVPSSVARERRRRKIIFVAHIDTVRAQPEAMPSVVNALPVFKQVLYYVMIAVPVLLVVRMLPLPWPDTVDFALWIVSLVGCVFLLVCFICIVANRFMPYVTGANDNASSIAVLLGLAKRLLDPAERERYAKEDQETEEGEFTEGMTEVFEPVETFAPGSTGTFEVVSASETVAMPAIHGEQAAIEAGVVPEGATIEYAPDIAAGVLDVASAAETTVMPAIGTAAAAVDGTAEAAGVAAVENVAESVAPEPVEAGVPSWYTAAKRKAAAVETEDASEEENLVRSQYAHMPTTRAAARAMFEQERAAEAAAAAAADEDEAAPQVAEEDLEMVESMRGRSANDILVELGVDPAEAPSVESAPTNDDQATVSAVSRVAAPALAQQAAGDSAPKKPQITMEDTPAGETIEDSAAENFEDNVISMAAFKGQLAVADVDDLEPSLTGAFSADDVVENLSRRLSDLDGRIPSIGQSEDNEQAANAFETYAAVDAGDAQPLNADDFAVEEEIAAEPEPATGLAAGITGSFRALKERRAAAKEARAAAPKVNYKPTTRRAGADFEPTQARDARDDAIDALAQSRQKAAVSSTYEDTIQAAPKTQAFDPFAPKGSPAADASLISPSASTSFPAINFDPIPEPAGAASSPASRAAAPGSTSSFPSLISSFPTLESDFDNSSFFSQPAADEFDDSNFEAFNGFAPSMDKQIGASANRLHNAMDKVGGLFGKFGKKKDTDDLGFDDGWTEDENGWKGGGYFDSDLAEDSRAAMRERAAQIRESVVSMTENDLLDKEVWFVALGASNAGNKGMKNFLELHQKELRGALIVNLEGVGSGDICFVDYEGGSKAHRSDRRLQSLVRKASKDYDGMEMRAERLTWRDTDATPAMEAGVRAMSIMGFDGVAPTGWHWSTDYTGIVEEEKLQYVTSVLLKMVENS